MIAGCAPAANWQAIAISFSARQMKQRYDELCVSLATPCRRPALEVLAMGLSSTCRLKAELRTCYAACFALPHRAFQPVASLYSERPAEANTASTMFTP